MFFSHPFAFGLDLSDLSIKIALLKYDGKHIELASFGRQEIPESVIESGVIKKEEELIGLIKKTVAEAQGEKIKTRNCIVSLPEKESYIRVVQLPKIKKEEISEAIKWELEANIPVPLDELYFDWQEIKRNFGQAEHSEVLIGALPKTLIDPYLDVIKKAGLEPLAFEIESVATARALVKDEISADTIMIIDLGGKKTTLVVWGDNTILFTTGLPISSTELIYDIAKNLKVDKEKAKQLKFSVGLDEAKENGKVYRAMEPRILGLVGETKKYIDYVQASKLGRSGKQDIAKILLCGGGANLKGLPAYLSARLRVNVSVGNPWVNIFDASSNELPGINFDDSLSYTTALGLALRGLKEN
jgi:type IV pilus assembly protein PilM